MLIVGAPDDPHVAAVAAQLESPTIFDASTLAERDYELRPEAFAIDGVAYGAHNPCRGWIRRLAPAEWSHGTTTGSRLAAAQAADISLLAAIARTPGIDWLTDLDPLLISESKIVQVRAATRLGIRTPATVITTSNATARARLGQHVVIKPLGPGHFSHPDGASAVVYATAVDLDDPAFANLGPTPFLIQELIPAATHHRVVTVGHDCWVTTLDAGQRPLDWRSQESAHHAFVHDLAPTPALTQAGTQLAHALGLGYSSQDWVSTAAGELVMLDVNPGGQWAFLPEPVTSDVAATLAAWLRGDR